MGRCKAWTIQQMQKKIEALENTSVFCLCIWHFFKLFKLQFFFISLHTYYFLIIYLSLPWYPLHLPTLSLRNSNSLLYFCLLVCTPSLRPSTKFISFDQPLCSVYLWTLSLSSFSLSLSYFSFSLQSTPFSLSSLCLSPFFPFSYFFSLSLLSPSLSSFYLTSLFPPPWLS